MPNPDGVSYNLKFFIMPGTFSQIYIQIVFAVKGRQNLIHDSWKNDLHKYIAGIIGKDQKPIIVNGMHDHIHAFVGLRPAMAIADLARDIKNNSSNFINDHKFVKGKFAWQEARLTGRAGIWRFFIFTFAYRKSV
jgi:REP element-mobilizing transposase RayT